ncbi:NAD-dependent DNA ligase LigA [Kineococcus rhizosphaerae]|uniref:DNA ligase n=1 Tax=Kineococcus rhizosphaerae TaxID=559628 RepID=A0A2T0QNH2_9ACTN|nr:NAD-dependent DNA ligase LigA [Kineococcus rhizosphaerae]PRY06017.1 DNA ligase (NAD+) [Kineococcus rhizosphaerae]
MTEISTNPGAFTDQASFTAAVAQVQEAEVAYRLDQPLMPDSAFDALKDRVAATKAAHPDWNDEGVTTQVASGASVGGDVRHSSPMLSLAKATTVEEVRAFITGLTVDGQEPGPLVVEVKMDGCAISARYENGALVLAAQRGDGTSGEDITGQITRGAGVAGLPARLTTSAGQSWSGEVRGEVYMSETDFDAANELRVAAGSAPFANPRNAVSGSLRNIDRTYDVPMSFAAYDLLPTQTDSQDSTGGGAGGELATYSQSLGTAQTLGFATARQLLPQNLRTPHEGTEDVLAAIEAIEALRPALGFPIDGSVLKVDSLATRRRLGQRTGSPRWALAYKYAPDTAVTTLRDIEISVGRTGRLGFRAVLDPVAVGGTTITYVTMHNAPWIIERDLRIGDEVWVYRAGDVIPRVTSANLAARPADAQPWSAPTHCPQCGEELDTTSLLWRCHTPSCSIAGALDYWASSDALDIDGIGTVVCEALAETGLARDVADLYDLTVAQWASLPLGVTETGATRTLGELNAAKIVDGLEASKTQPLNRVITGLGIRMTGRSVGRWLAARFGSMDALRAASVEELAAINKLGTIKATHIADGLTRLSPVIDRLAAHGLTMTVPDDGAAKPLAGKTYVVSGAVPGYTRTTIAERIEALGGTASSSVSAKTTALVTAETDTAKARKAAQLDIPVIDPTEFAAMLA